MKKAVEYLKELFEEPFELEEESIEKDFYTIIKQVQEDTIKATVLECSKNADANIDFHGWLADRHEEMNFKEGEDYDVYVINSSILEVADKLIKEL